jgi:RNA polymerase sigma factor (sigma-70 family)
MTPDCELLRRYAETSSEESFAELVRRHLDLVYSAALRQVNGDAHLAQDVAQTVFTDLARKAVPLSRREVLTGWLYTSTHFAAAKAARTEGRRRAREQEAHTMRELLHDPASDMDWDQLHSVLDEAMHKLKDGDREAILLRYFEKRPLAEIGAKLGVNENTARMRVERALEKLRAQLVRRGVTTTAAALSTAITVNAIQIAPAGLAATLASASLAGVVAGTGTTLTILRYMAIRKVQTAIVGAVAVVGMAYLTVQHQAQVKLRGENQSLRQQVDQFAQLKAEYERLSNLVAQAENSKLLASHQLSELLRLRAEVGQLRQQTNEFARLQKENQQIHNQITAMKNQPDEVTRFRLHRIDMVNATKQLGLAVRIYANGHANQYATNFDQLANELKDCGVTREGTIMGDVRLSDIEFCNVGLVDETMPLMITFREKISRKTPDGKWERVYGFADGSVETVGSEDGNFDAYEKEHSPPPAGQ